MLNTQEGYTPAYTLKGICIQLLSFFSSDKIEQDYGGVVDLKNYGQAGIYHGSLYGHNSETLNGFQCKKCGFGGAVVQGVPENAMASNALSVRVRDPTSSEVSQADEPEGERSDPSHPVAGQQLELVTLPSEVLLLICEWLDDEDLALTLRAWNGFGRLLRTHNLIAVREMQCFTLKKGFKDCKLGVGVAIDGRAVQSEFDYISEQAFKDLHVRRSVQGLHFQHWLPFSLSETHWKRVKTQAEDALWAIGAASVPGPPVTVLYNFMNDVVVNLSKAASEADQPQHLHRYLMYGMEQKSTLTHASEKAITSYYQLVHLLLCLAAEKPFIVKNADDRIKDFMDGKTDKQACPNLGHLLISLLITSHDVNEQVVRGIIKEAITRNVVWMLDQRGAGRAELSFKEASAISEYRLKHTFEASLTSYRLLMFQNLMRQTVVGTRKLSVNDLRNELFTRHGAPPEGAAADLAAAVRNIQQVKTFPQFLKAMGTSHMPSKAEFTTFLRRTLDESVAKGYSKWAMTQDEALILRLQKEPGVDAGGVRPAPRLRMGQYTFFPERGGGGRGGHGGYSGRGGGGDRGGYNGRGGFRGGRGGRWH